METITKKGRVKAAIKSRLAKTAKLELSQMYNHGKSIIASSAGIIEFPGIPAPPAPGVPVPSTPGIPPPAVPGSPGPPAPAGPLTPTAL